MAKVALFGLLWYLFGNPFVAIIVLLVVLYILDRRFIGLTPSLLKPFRTARKIGNLRQDLHANPHDAASKIELARLLIERKKYREAADLLEETKSRLPDSADLHAELGLCLLKLGDLQRGEALMEKAVELNPRVRYGEPYLRLAEAFAGLDPQKAMAYLERFGEVNSSSCEAYYVLAELYRRLGRLEEAKRAYRETLHLYRSLPKYSRKQQRKWALLAKLKGGA
jgi:tetratricopeptide (TPR) repeat protein